MRAVYLRHVYYSHGGKSTPSYASERESWAPLARTVHTFFSLSVFGDGTFSSLAAVVA